LDNLVDKLKPEESEEEEAEEPRERDRL